MFFCEELLLRPKGDKHRGIHINAVCGNLIGFDREQGLPLADDAALVDKDLPDGPTLRHEDLGGARGRREIADCGLLTRVLCDK